MNRFILVRKSSLPAAVEWLNLQANKGLFSITEQQQEEIKLDSGQYEISNISVSYIRDMPDGSIEMLVCLALAEEVTFDEQCHEVVRLMTPMQLKVLQAFARGLKPSQVADELGISLVTVNSHKTQIAVACREVWHLPKDEYIAYPFFRERFARFFKKNPS